MLRTQQNLDLTSWNLLGIFFRHLYNHPQQVQEPSAFSALLYVKKALLDAVLLDDSAAVLVLSRVLQTSLKHPLRALAWVEVPHLDRAAQLTIVSLANSRALATRLQTLLSLGGVSGLHPLLLEDLQLAPLSGTRKLKCESVSFVRHHRSYTFLKTKG